MSIRSLCGTGLMLLLASGIARANPACGDMRSQLVDADAETLMEIVMRGIDCADVHRTAVARMETMIARDALPEDADADDLQELVYVLAIAKMDAALAQRDVAAAREASRGVVEAMLAIAGAEGEEGPDPEADEAVAAALEQLASVERVLSGDAPEPAVAAIDAPAQGWMVYRSRCGFRSLVEGLPSLADAWHAIGRDDVAVQVELSEQWTDAMGVGRLPSRLRVYADAAFGDGAFKREWEIALAAITIEDTLTGRRASMPLFGGVVPLPIGEHRPFDGADDVLWTVQALREHMRGLAAGANE